MEFLFMLLSRVYSAVLLTVVTATPALAAPVIVDNIQGYGFDEKRALVPFQSLVFDDATGKVLARGDKSAVAAYSKAEQIDGKGQTLLPGLIDGHGHVLGLGQNLNQVDLRTSSSEAQAVAQVLEEGGSLAVEAGTGVGKTYRMLQEAARRQADGLDVVVDAGAACVIQPGSQALLLPLKIISLLFVSVSGIFFQHACFKHAQINRGFFIRRQLIRALLTLQNSFNFGHIK